jgi:hypothetical protein
MGKILRIYTKKFIHIILNEYFLLHQIFFRKLFLDLKKKYGSGSLLMQILILLDEKIYQIKKSFISKKLMSILIVIR